MEQKTKKSLFDSGMRLSILTLVSRVLGLFREMTKAAFLGTSPLGDAFGIAFMIPNLFRRLFAENSISVAFIPAFKGYLEDVSGQNRPNAREDTAQFLNSVFTVISFLTALVATAGVALAPVIVPLFYDVSKTGVLSETVLLTRVMFPYLFVISLAAFYQGILNALKIFTPSGFTPVLFNLIVIASAYGLSRFFDNPARAMAIGVIAGGLVQAAFQLPFVLRMGWRPRLTGLFRAFSHPGVRQVLARVGPTIIGMAAYQLNDIVSTALAGRAGSGVVSSLQYSLRLQELILGVFAVSIGTVILPDLSGLARNQQWKQFSHMLSGAIQIIALITIPATFFSLVTGENIIVLIYKNGNFTDESVAMTLKVFLFHIAGLFFIALNRIIAPAFYAQGDTKSPTVAGIIGFVVNMALAALLVKPYAGSGIALALSIASAVNTLALFVFLKKNNNIALGSVIKPSLKYTLKILCISLFAAGALLAVKPLLAAAFEGLPRVFSQGLFLILGAMLFAGIGVCLLLITKDAYLLDLLYRFTKKPEEK
jgi:putative peptidoglycan lipid II flippase